jgi:ferrous iron transport protein A
MVKLTQLKAGVHGQIVDITADQLIRERFLELGLAPGRFLRVVCRLPFEGPTVVQSGSTFVALRDIEAQALWVDVV